MADVTWSRRTAGGNHSPEPGRSWYRQAPAAERQRCSPSGWCSVFLTPQTRWMPTGCSSSPLPGRQRKEEMRERTAVKLRAVQREHPEDSTVARQLILLEKADISTVHAFCQRIVKENFQLLDIQSGFRIADEKELEVWRTEAAGEILEEEYAAGEASFLSLVELLSEERSDRRVTDTLLRLYDFIRAPSVL